MLKRLALDRPFSALEWEESLATYSWQQVVARVSETDPNVTSLRLLATLASRDDEEIVPVLQRLDRNEGLARGARLLALNDLKRYADVVAEAHDTHPRGTSDVDLFDAATASFAAGLAYSVTGRMDLSQMHLHAALLLAKGLGLKSRQQIYALEYESIRARRGEGNLTAIQAAMDLHPMGVQRQIHAHRIMADVALMSGDYHLALNLTGPDDVRGLVATALLGGEVVLPEKLVRLNSPYAQLAVALADPTAPVPGALDVDPFASYARLLKVMRMMSEPGGEDQAGLILHSLDAKGADQKILQAALILSAYAQGARVMSDSATVATLLREGLQGLTHRRPLAHYLRQQMPELLMILAHLPGAPVEWTELVTTVPLFVGNAVRFEGRVYGLPGEIGSGILAREIQGRRPVTVHSMKTWRYTKAWEALPIAGYQPVSLVRLARAVHWLSRHEGGMANQTWKTALESLVGMARGTEVTDVLMSLVDQGEK
ncbi:hypothetical protein [Deinococcus multiflagellatus]|uniref:hypothetical protein n=1 Tax=Deinococcus multiflagellatus TaxID=1656887 RepID=UPI001CCF46DF|nr:hypothetical protein [Deinococcus multiflagellatus]MBZ9715330.1 hypothetical protein [Deinococcus multiflagellatus]